MEMNGRSFNYISDKLNNYLSKGKSQNLSTSASYCRVGVMTVT